MIEMTDDEQARVAEMLGELHECGYIDIQEHNALRPGVRVHHRGQRWPEAYIGGTGNVVAITERPDSAWSYSWGAADIELIVLFDKPGIGGSRLSALAQYHVAVIGDGS